MKAKKKATAKKKTPYEQKLKLTTLSDYKDKTYGKRGTPKRESFEQELKAELIGELLREVREEKGITQTEVARLLGIKDKSGVSKIENNLSAQRIDTLMKFVSALKARIFIRLEYDDTSREVELV